MEQTIKNPAVEGLNSGLLRTNPDKVGVEDLNQGTLDFKSSALNHSAKNEWVIS